MDLIIKVSKVSEGYLMSFRVANSDEKFNPEEQKKDIAVFEVIKHVFPICLKVLTCRYFRQKTNELVKANIGVDNVSICHIDYASRDVAFY